MSNVTGRIITRATEYVVSGADIIDAIEDACAAVYASEASRERARKIFIAAAAKVERSA